MTQRREILFLCHRIPYPPDKGDKIRSWRLLEFLLNRFDVHLACFIDDRSDRAHCEYLENRCASAVFVDINPNLKRLTSMMALLKNKPLTFDYFYTAAMRKEVERLRRRPLAAEIAFSSAMAPYMAPPVSGRVRIVDFCDADSEKWNQYSEESGWPLKWLFAREGDLLARAEDEIAQWADASFAVSPNEAAIFNDRAGNGAKVDYWSNGVDVGYFNPEGIEDTATHSIDLVFVGAMDYRANCEAVLNFVRDVWPVIRAAKPGARFAVVGARPTSEIKALNDKDGITVTGRVADVRPWLGGAKIAIAPMRVARGVQNKVLEAMAMAKPVVGTTAAFEGVAVDPQTVCVANDADAIARSVLALLDDPQKAKAMGAAARATVATRYDWSEQLQRFENALSDLKF